MLQVEVGSDSIDVRSPGSTLRQGFEGALPPSRWSMGPDALVFVGLFDLHDWRPWLAEAHEMLDARERDRVQRRHAASDRDQLALGYALHRLLLGKVLGLQPADVPIGRDEAGCPRLAGAALSTSLSHADRALALAITATGPVGVDIEPLSRASVMPEIAGRVCHPAEAAEMAKLSERALCEALLALWVRKEAFLKAAGIGLQREMPTFAAPDSAVLALPGGEMTQVRMLDAGAHWVAAVASAPDVVVESVWLRPVRA